MESENMKEAKTREFKYDNIKFILIFLVVFGHIIENQSELNIFYLIIYSFHMPVFIFISGYFSKGTIKSIVKPICIYIIFQTLYFFTYKYVLKENITLNYLQPIWILWYIFSIAIWNSLVFIIKRIDIKNKMQIYIIIALTFLISIVCGFIDDIGYYLSLSRILAFLPFFLLGYFTKNNDIKLLKNGEKYNKLKYLACFTIMILCTVYFISLQNINRIWFYGSYSYKNAGCNSIFRVMLNLFSLCVIFLFNNFTINKKIFISAIGKNTLYIYLLHGIIIKLINFYHKNLFHTNNVPLNIIIATTLSLAIIVRN